MRWMAWMSCWRKSGGNTGVKVPDLTEKSCSVPRALLVAAQESYQGGGTMKAVTIELPWEVLRLLGMEEKAKRETKIAVIQDLVRRGKVSRAKAAELLQISLWDLPAFLAQYRIPYFDCSPEDLEGVSPLRSNT